MSGKWTKNANCEQPYSIIIFTMAPNGSEFSHRVWISFFKFYYLALSLRKFTESYCIVPMYVFTNLLRNKKSRSSWKWIAGMITQWFWCKYFAHIFILYSKLSKKMDRLHILYLNTAVYSLWVPGVVLLCLGGKNGIVTIPHCDSGSARKMLTFMTHPCPNVCGIMRLRNYSKRAAAALSAKKKQWH